MITGPEDLQSDEERDQSTGFVQWLTDHKLASGLAAVFLVLLLATVLFWPSGEIEEPDQLTIESSPALADESAPPDRPIGPKITTPEPPSETEELAEAQNARAVQFFKQRDYSAVIEELNLAAEKLPGDPEVFYMRGRSYLETKQINRAIRDLRKAVSIVSSNARYHLYLGTAFESGNNWGEAAKHISRAGSLGGYGDLKTEDLEAKAAYLELMQQLEDSTPVSSDVEHDHFIGHCTGILEMTSSTLAYRPEEKPEHAFEFPILDLISVEVRVQELRLVLPGNESFNFKLEDPEKFSAVYHIKKKLGDLPSL